MITLTTTEGLADYCARARQQPYVAVDTEFLPERTYYSQLCLIQLAYPGTAGEFLDEPIQARKDAAAEYGRSRYHQADDEWSADWDLRGMAEDLQVLFWIGRDLANSRDWPGWKAGSEFGPVRERSDASRR